MNGVQGQAHAGGIVTFGPDCGAVRATLVTPGLALQAAAARGCAGPGVLEARGEEKRCEWSMVLPAGTWRLEPITCTGCTATPDSVDVEVAPGSWVRQDFAITPPDAQDAGKKIFGLCVRVREPDGNPTDGASVSVWAQDSEGTDGEPLRRQPTRHGQVVFHGLEKQALHVVASHDSWLEGEQSSTDWELPEGRGFTQGEADEKAVTIVLQRGARLVGAAWHEPGGETATGVKVVVRAQGEPPLLTALAGTADRWRHHVALTDSAGRFAIGPLHEGSYAVSAPPSDTRTTTHRVQLRESGGSWQRELKLDLAPPRETAVEVRLVPAASLTVQVACDQGGRLPPRVDVRVLSAADALAVGVSPAEALAHAVFSRADVTLSGDQRDSLFIGPLEPDAWVLAVRSLGFQRWTFAQGTEDLADAMVIASDASDTIPLPPLLIDCAPRVRLALVVPAGAPLPDLRDASVSATWAPLDPQRLDEGQGGALLATRGSDDIELRGAPAGPVMLRIRVSHRHFLPAASVLIEGEFELKDGGPLELPLRLTGVGASLEVVGAGRAARVATLDGALRSAPVEDGRALIDNLPPSAWRVELCADDDCQDRMAQWTLDELLPATHVVLTARTSPLP